MIRVYAIAALGALATAGASAAVYTAQPTFEESEAHREEGRIFQRPIAGLANKFWYNYQADLNEARKELASDLGQASDLEDLRDSWEEYRGELIDGRADYVQQMAKRGYRVPSVEVVD